MDGAGVSVVIPVHNRRERVQRAVRSVLRQEEKPREIIVVDDGSDDDSAAAVETLAAEEGASVAVHIIRHRRNLGVSAARNRGVAEACGEWIAFLDSDDEWLPHKLGAQLELISHNPDRPLCHSDEIWFRNGTRVNPMRKHQKHGGWIFRRCLPLCVISPSATLLRRDVLCECGGFDESLPVCEDYDLWLRLCARYPVLCAPQPLLVKHGGHADQLSRRHWGMDRFRVRALEKILHSGVLGDEDFAAARETLLTKLKILNQGADKHGNSALQQTCAAQIMHWQESTV